LGHILGLVREPSVLYMNAGLAVACAYPAIGAARLAFVQRFIKAAFGSGTSVLSVLTRKIAATLATTVHTQSALAIGCHASAHRND
jgi:hypothetical protein